MSKAELRVTSYECRHLNHQSPITKNDVNGKIG